MSTSNNNLPEHYPDYEENKIQVEVQAGKVPERIDTYLSKLIRKASRTKIRKSLDDGLVTVNGKVVTKASYKVTGNDKIECVLYRRPPIKLVAQDIPLDIIYEDEYLLVVNKPPNFVVHPGVGNRHSTLVNALLFHLGIEGEIEIDMAEDDDDSEDENFDEGRKFASTELRPGIVHRLDKDTSGLLVVAKSTEILTQLQLQFADRTVSRTYQAIIWGDKLQDSGSVIGNIDRSTIDRKKFAVSTKSGKYAKTNFQILERYTIASLAELKLETGRTHQIRVHMAHMNSPVLGDEQYGGKRNNYNGVIGELNNIAKYIVSKANRQMLHAKDLSFIHPVTQTKMTFTSELPNDMREILEILHNFFKQS